VAAASVGLSSAAACVMPSVSGRSAVKRAVEADAEHAIAVLRLYLSLLRWAAAQFPFTIDDPDRTIQTRLHEVAVFQLGRPA
jgi:hypothetical protein